MAGKVKGITIEIEGKTSGLVKSLSNVDSQLSKTQSKLKEIDKALKFDPGNTELIAAKQRALAEAIEETKEKLELQKTAAQKAAEALAEGKLSQTDYDAMQAEITQTAAALEDLENKAKNVGTDGGIDFSGIKSGFESVGGTITQVGEKVDVVSQKFREFGEAAYSAYDEVDNVLDTINYATGADGETLAEYRELAQVLTEELPEGLDTTAAAVGAVATRFPGTTAQVKNLSTQFIKFSKITGTDVVSNISSAQNILNSWNLDVQHTGAVLDTMAAVSQNTGLAVSDLTRYLNDDAYVFQQLGWTLGESATFLGQVASSGADVSTVMGGLDKALKAATSDGKPLNEALAELQATCLSAESDTEALTAAYDVFGKKAPEILNAVQNGTLSFTETSGSLADYFGTVESTYGGALDATDELAMAQSTLKNTLAAVGADIAVDLIPIIQDATGALREFRDWWNSLSPSTKDAIIGIGAFVAALGPVLIAVGSAITSVSGLITLFETLAPLITGVLVPAIAAIALPVLAVIAVFAALAMAGIAAYDALVTHGEDWAWALDQVKAKATETWNNIVSTLGDAVLSVQDNMSSIWDSITAVFDDAISNALTWGGDLIDNFISGISAGIDRVRSAARSIAQAVQDNIGFSEPKEGPLSNFHTYAPDMLDLWNEGIYENLDSVRDSSQALAGTVSQELDYTDNFDTLTTAVNNQSRGSIVIPVYIGNKQIDNLVVDSINSQNFRSGGR